VFFSTEIEGLQEEISEKTFQLGEFELVENG
jgi:hypothetical protein